MHKEEGGAKVVLVEWLCGRKEEKDQQWCKVIMEKYGQGEMQWKLKEPKVHTT